MAYRILPLAALGEKEWAELTKLQGDLLYDKGDLRAALEAYGRLLRAHTMAVMPPASIERACQAHLQLHNASGGDHSSESLPLDEWLGKDLRMAACGSGVCAKTAFGAVWCAESAEAKAAAAEAKAAAAEAKAAAAEAKAAAVEAKAAAEAKAAEEAKAAAEAAEVAELHRSLESLLQSCAFEVR